MANVASNICCAWPSTVASIPSGWSRETSLDDRYVRGAAAGADSDLVTSFGQATHTHTESGSHANTANSHSHSVSGGNNTGTSNYNTGGSNSLIGLHTHDTSSSAGVVVTVNTATISIGTASNDPPYRKVIWIKSDGTPTGFPNGSYAWFSSDTLPSSWTRVEGNNFLLGASAGADGTGTGGSSNSHSHAESGSHTHTQTSHGSGHNASSSVGSAAVIGGSTSLAAADQHAHALTFEATLATCNASTVTIGTADGQPPWYKLNTISNGTGGVSFPDQIIAIYLGTNGSIPSNWARYSAMDDNFLKSANANGEIGSTGGGSAHNHSGSCATTGPSHNHTVTGGGADLTVGKGNNATASVASTNHTHVWTSIAATITFQDASITINNNTSETNFPLYQKVIFVKWTEPAAAAASQYLPMLGVGS